MSELYVSERDSPYRGLKLPDGTWISSDICVETFVLKKVPHSIINFNTDSGRKLCSPLWFIKQGDNLGRPIRFKGIRDTLHSPIVDFLWMSVYYFDNIQHLGGVQRLLTKKMDWEVLVNEGFSFFKTIDFPHTVRWRREASFTRRFLKDYVQIIRLKMYWILRGIVSFQRLLSRCRLRREKRMLLIQATSWRQPKSGLSCFSSSINGPVTRRIHDYI